MLVCVNNLNELALQLFSDKIELGEGEGVWKCVFLKYFFVHDCARQLYTETNFKTFWSSEKLENTNLHYFKFYFMTSSLFIKVNNQ